MKLPRELPARSRACLAEMIVKRALKKLFITKEGKIVIAQLPNFSGALTILFILLKWRSAAAVTGLYWSYLEIRHGVNYFRRILGGVVALMILKQIIQSFL